MEDAIHEVPISCIEVDSSQPRNDPGDLEGLIASIGRYGIIQPPIVTPIAPERYRILAGERRFTAAKELGFERIQVVVRSIDEQHRGYLQLVENLQREDLDPFEQAAQFRKLMDEYGISEEQLGARVGKSQDYVSRALTIAENVPPEIRQDYYATSRKVPPSILLEIARADTTGRKLRMWERARAGGYTVRQARKERAGHAVPQKESGQPPDLRREIIELEDATITIMCHKSVNPEQVLDLLQEALERWAKQLGGYFHLNEGHSDCKSKLTTTSSCESG